MDNFTHSLAGWILGQAGLKRASRKGLAALILAANMPDIDVFFGHSCWTPLATHRGFTHSLIGGVVVMPPLLAGLLWLFDRWQNGRGVVFRSGLPMRFGWLVALCYIGALSHPLLDWLTSYAVQLHSPFSTRWFRGEALFIIDVWLWTMLAVAIALSRRREKSGRDGRWAARAGITAALAYIGGNYALTVHAKEQLRAQSPYPPMDTVIARFEPVRFWVRGLVWRSGDRIGYARWTPSEGLRQIAAPAPDNMNDPLARRAMFATPELRRFMRWSILPVAQIERGRCRARVIFTDARYPAIDMPLRRGRNPFRHEVVVPTGAPGCA